jgi:hypothetical protein
MSGNLAITIGVFGLGFLSGYLVRKNWYLVRALFGLRNKPAETAAAAKKSNNKKNDLKEKQSDLENVNVESSEIDKSVC